MEQGKIIALLIDAENVSPKYIKTIVDEVSMSGTPAYKRIYGDWTASDMISWKKVLLEYNLTPIQQFSYTQGKNASDSAMIIDAMDILYAKNVDGFCLVSSDSDFTRLAARLRESRMFVIGMGESKTPTAFKSACDTFKYLDVLMGRRTEKINEPIMKQEEKLIAKSSKTQAKQTVKQQNKKTETKQAAPIQQEPVEPHIDAFVPLEEIIAKIKEIIEIDSDENGLIPLSQVGIMLSRLFADFDSRNYGFSKLHNLVDSAGVFDTFNEQLTNGSKNLLIKNK